MRQMFWLLLGLGAVLGLASIALWLGKGWRIIMGSTPLGRYRMVAGLAAMALIPVLFITGERFEPAGHPWWYAVVIALTGAGLTLGGIWLFVEAPMNSGGGKRSAECKHSDCDLSEKAQRAVIDRLERLDISPDISAYGLVSWYGTARKLEKLLRGEVLATDRQESVARLIRDCELLSVNPAIVSLRLREHDYDRTPEALRNMLKHFEEMP